MGWAGGGEVIYKGKARRIGYGVAAKCDGGCGKTIDRGMGYACGGTHGNNNGRSCEGYYCGECLGINDVPSGIEEILADPETCEVIGVCPECYKRYLQDVKEEKAFIKSMLKPKKKPKKKGK